MVSFSLFQSPFAVACIIGSLTYTITIIDTKSPNNGVLVVEGYGFNVKKSFHSKTKIQKPYSMLLKNEQRLMSVPLGSPYQKQRSSLSSIITHSEWSSNYNCNTISIREQQQQDLLLHREKKIDMVQRDSIRMPSQRPMVPYMPPGSRYAQFIDMEAAMYRDRTIMINTFIDDQAANNLISIMLYLRNESPRDKISMYFNVPGAYLRPALALYDLIQNTKKTCDIETVNLALCAGMGAMLCSAGTKGMRCAMPNSRFLLHRTGMDNVYRGQATDIALEVQNVKLWNDRMEKELSMLTGQKLDNIQKEMKRDFYLTADEAVQYGLIDKVLLPSPRKRAARGQEADLGMFEGEMEQRYQSNNNDNKDGGGSRSGGGGWGSRTGGDVGQGSNDDDEPKIMKG